MLSSPKSQQLRMQNGSNLNMEGGVIFNETLAFVVCVDSFSFLKTGCNL